jgi:Rad3-related DNA helicase
MSLLRKLSILSSANPSDWVCEETERNEFNFDPVRPARYAESTLLLQTPRIIIVSATLRPKTLFMLGIGKINYDFFEFESDFDPQRCPIYWIPTMRVDSRSGDLGQLWARLDQIVAKRQDRKGVIHTISYARQKDVLAKSRFSNKMLVNYPGIPATSMVELFRASDAGSILVSPSVATGYDFPGRDCEWQFLCKIPFPDGRTKINKARTQDDPEFGAYQAMQTMVQAFGRGMRSKEDQCECFIPDDHLQWFIPRFRHLAPNSFYRLFRKVDVLPQPLRRLP